MPTPPRRRWYQFSLRTMFVLTVIVSIPLAWVGYSLNWIRQRQAVLADKKEVDFHSFIAGVGNSTRLAEAPVSLRMFGEPGVAFIYLAEESRMPTETVKLLFPEAYVFTWSEWVEFRY